MKRFLFALLLVGGFTLGAETASAQGLQVNGYGISYPYSPYYLSPTYYGYNYGPRFNTYAPGPPNSGWGYRGGYGYGGHGGHGGGYGGGHGGHQHQHHHHQQGW